MTTTTIHVQEKRKRPINRPLPTPLRIKEDSHVIKKLSFSSQKKTRLPKLCGLITNTPPPKIIHANAREFKTLVQRLTGLSRPNEVIENGKRPMNDVDVDHRCKGSSSSFNPIHECYLTSHPYLVDMPYPYLGHDIPNYLTDLSLSLVPNLTYLSLSPLPVYTYAETISFSTLPNIGSSISPVRSEFLDIGTINNGFGL
ncbi:hypothetical protein RHGRI_021337 [Rhododendron griersonianum]|uniref:VQ domain-containing protein n=1 Tax=Rhododendron griersonianum TaxID=479676 RepID=A0AAV6JPC7_9ERIC|nr:hypothetical protein RHGRI_021337 [Rhododendron griersonianum]